VLRGTPGMTAATPLAAGLLTTLRSCGCVIEGASLKRLLFGFT